MYTNPGSGHAGLTLIELLIVVSIIAILATIAVGNYAESATRAKVSAAHNNMRVLANSLEAYAADNNGYPPATGVGIHRRAPYLTNPVSCRLIPLTTPISYVTASPKDPMLPGGSFWTMPDYDTFDYLDSHALMPRGCGLTSGAEWRLASAGPDSDLAFGGRTVSETTFNARGVDYDPTNGTRSQGDIVRVGPPSTAGGDPADVNNPTRPGNLRTPRYTEQWH